MAECFPGTREALDLSQIQEKEQEEEEEERGGKNKKIF